MSNSEKQGGRERYQQQVEARLRELDAEIELLRAKSSRIRADAETGGNNLLNKLSARREAVANRLSEYRDAADSALDQVRRGVDDAVEDLKTAVKDASEELSRSND